MSDAGASIERTRLAWRRTGLSASAAALLAVRPAFRPHPGAATILVTVAMTAAWAALVVLGHRRTRTLEDRPPRPVHRTIPLYAMIAIGMALIGGLVVTL